MCDNKFLLKPLCVALFLGMAGQVSAGGFGVTVQSATGGGNAATGHAMAEDASAMFYNPALLFSMDGRQINGGAALLSTDVTVTNTGSTVPSAAAGTPVIGNNVGDPSGISVTPSFFYRGGEIMNGLVYGVGVNVPFGVSTEYEEDSFVRYEATESSLKTLNINPAVAYQVNDQFEIGAGLNVQVGQAILGKSTDSFLICRGILGATAAAIANPATPAAALPQLNATLNAANGTCGAGGTLNAASIQANDGAVSIEATGVGFGANLGMVYRPSAATTLSVGLRSPVTLELEGDADFTNNAALVNGLGDAILAGSGFGDQEAKSTLKMPASASFAVAHQVNDKLTVHGDVTWTQWSSIPEIKIEFPDTVASDSVTELKWEDTVRYGIGATYQLNDRIRLRGGIAMDPVPTPGPENRTPRAPSADNLWISAGGSYQLNKHFTIDAGLSLVKPSDASINYTAPGTSDYLTRADVDSDVISAALSVNYRF